MSNTAGEVKAGHLAHINTLLLHVYQVALQLMQTLIIF